MPEQPEGGVTYSVKELLAQINAKLDALFIEVGQKARASDVEKLIGRIELAEKSIYTIQLSAMDNKIKGRSALDKSRFWIGISFPAIISLITSAAIVAATLYYNHK